MLITKQILFSLSLSLSLSLSVCLVLPSLWLLFSLFVWTWLLFLQCWGLWRNLFGYPPPSTKTNEFTISPEFLEAGGGVVVRGGGGGGGEDASRPHIIDRERQRRRQRYFSDVFRSKMPKWMCQNWWHDKDTAARGAGGGERGKRGAGLDGDREGREEEWGVSPLTGLLVIQRGNCIAAD